MHAQWQSEEEFPGSRSSFILFRLGLYVNANKNLYGCMHKHKSFHLTRIHVSGMGFL